VKAALTSSETVLLCGSVKKQGPSLVSPFRPRILVLTSAPRLVYLSPLASDSPGFISLGSKSCVVGLTHKGQRFELTAVTQHHASHQGRGQGRGGKGGEELRRFYFEVETWNVCPAKAWVEAIQHVLSREAQVLGGPLGGAPLFHSKMFHGQGRLFPGFPSQSKASKGAANEAMEAAAEAGEFPHSLTRHKSSKETAGQSAAQSADMAPSQKGPSQTGPSRWSPRHKPSASRLSLTNLKFDLRQCVGLGVEAWPSDDASEYDLAASSALPAGLTARLDSGSNPSPCRTCSADGSPDGSAGGVRGDSEVAAAVTRFLRAGESAVRWGLVAKRGKTALSPFKARLLVLSSKRRLVYASLRTQKVVGAIQLTEKTVVGLTHRGRRFELAASPAEKPSRLRRYYFQVEQPEPEDAAGWVSKIEESVAELSCFADHLDPGQHPGQHPGLESEVAVFEAQLVTFLQRERPLHFALEDAAGSMLQLCELAVERFGPLQASPKGSPKPSPKVSPKPSGLGTRGPGRHGRAVHVGESPLEAAVGGVAAAVRAGGAAARARTRLGECRAVLSKLCVLGDLLSAAKAKHALPITDLKREARLGLDPLRLLDRRLLDKGGEGPTSTPATSLGLKSAASINQRSLRSLRVSSADSEASLVALGPEAPNCSPGAPDPFTSSQAASRHSLETAWKEASTAAAAAVSAAAEGRKTGSRWGLTRRRTLWWRGSCTT